MLKQVRFRVILPVTMVAVSALLLVIQNQQEWSGMLRGWGMGWQVPARTINSVINGPGFCFAPEFLAHRPVLHYDEHRLVSIALFWFALGFAIDRRRAGRSIVQSDAQFALALFGATAVLTAAWATDIVWSLLSDGNSSGYLRAVVFPYVLRVSRITPLSLAVWLFGFAIYFARKAWSARRSKA